MDTNQYELCLEILRRFSKCGLLKKAVLIGSWCLPFYKDYYFNGEGISILRTRDLNFLLPRRVEFGRKIDIPLSVLIFCISIIIMVTSFSVCMHPEKAKITTTKATGVRERTINYK